ncbi:unnamed protein product [Brachionus calyciflorus]|uniref:FLYWCH-type domain-containing protein n=1 Tax=Brachionus calyciflorus TaxID=104777 RepID=A0A814P7J9_9BILA|nr:unnamed protein product [Brachionus calyciflorus]
MNKNWLRDNSNFSPSIRRLRNRIIIEQQTLNIHQNIIENEVSNVLSDQTNDIQNSYGFSLMQNLNENIIGSESESSSSDESSDSDLSMTSTDSEQFEEVEEFYCELSDELNKLSIESKDFFITKTKRGGLKLCSLGYYYTKERLVKNINKYHWKCESTKSCNGRAHTIGLEGPVLITEIAENTKENPRDIMINVQKCDEQYIVVKNSNYENIRQVISRDPNSVKVDFEESVFNGIKKVFVKTHIYVCFFHLTEGFWRKMTKLGILREYYSSPECKNGFLMLKSLAYVPDELLKYVSKYYIGTKSRLARFPFPTWNLHSRVLANMPRTNNTVESWHNVFTVHEKKHLTINFLVEKMRKEK